MKLSTHLVLPSLSALIVAAAGREITPELIAECGSRENVMTVPDGADETQYRHCINHPVRDITPAFSHWDPLGKLDKRARLDKRACTSLYTGCTDGFCWRRCDVLDNEDDRKWCWTAYGEDGKGAWKRCRRSDECMGPHGTPGSVLSPLSCGQSNGKPCPDCGCDCRAKDAYKN